MAALLRGIAGRRLTAGWPGLPVNRVVPLLCACRSGSDIVPSGGLIDIPRIIPLPHPNFAVTGGTRLSQNVYDLLKYLENRDQSDASEHASDLAVTLRHLTEVVNSRVDEEPEKENLMLLLIQAIDTLDIVHDEELNKLLTSSNLSGTVNAADRTFFSRLAERIWERLPEQPQGRDILLAARALRRTPSSAPLAVMHALKSAEFVAAVRATAGTRGGDDASDALANLTLLAAFVQLRTVRQHTELLEVLCGNVAEQLASAPMPTTVHDALLLLDVAKAMVQHRYRHERLLISLAVYLLDICKAPEKGEGDVTKVTPFVSATAIAHFAYLLSRSSIPAVALFVEMEKLMKPTDYASLPADLLLHLVWSYAVQQMAPPIGALERLEGVVGDIPFGCVRLCGEELEQVQRLMRIGRLAAGDALRKHVPMPLRWFADVREKHPAVETDLLLEAGRVPLCVLVRAHDGAFLPWESVSVDPEEMRLDDAASLPGVPVAVLACAPHAQFAPYGQVSGPLHQKGVLLREAGWRVVYVDTMQRFGSRPMAVEALVAAIRSLAKRELGTTQIATTTTTTSSDTEPSA